MMHRTGEKTVSWKTDFEKIGGIALQILSKGSGQPLLIFHGEDVTTEVSPFEDVMSANFHVVVPLLPGLGQSELPEWMDDLDDLAYLGFDVVEFFRNELGKNSVNLLGHGFGGWVAAEMAIRSGGGLRRLVLVDSVGLKTSEPTVRDIADIYVLGIEEFKALAWHGGTISGGMKWPGMEGLREDELLALLRNRESVFRFGWRPFMHDPKLLRRLSRVNLPVQVIWGASDRVVSPEYGRAFHDAIPGSLFELVPRSGHYPHWEQPDVLARIVTSFLNA